MPDFCKAVADMGLTAVDLLSRTEWAVVRDHGLICSMGYAGGGTIPNGLNVKANHDAHRRRTSSRPIPQAAAMQGAERDHVLRQPAAGMPDDGGDRRTASTG